MKTTIEREGLNQDNLAEFWDMVRGLMDKEAIPDDILLKVGAVLSLKNQEALKEAQHLIQSVLDNARKPEQESVSDNLVLDYAIQAIRKGILTPH